MLSVEELIFLQAYIQWAVSIVVTNCSNTVFYLQVAAWVDYYRTHSGAEFMAQPKMTYSDHPSIQGMWHPHVHSEPEHCLAKYPNTKLGAPRNLGPTATENVLELYTKKIEQV